MGQFLVLGNAIDGSPPILEMQLGHVWVCPCMFQTAILLWFSTDFYVEKKNGRFPMGPNTAYVLESRLISMDGANQITMSEFEVRWHDSRVCVLYFQVCKFQFCLLAEYFISVNNCSCSDRNFGQTGGDLSF